MELSFRLPSLKAEARVEGFRRPCVLQELHPNDCGDVNWNFSVIFYVSDDASCETLISILLNPGFGYQPYPDNFGGCLMRKHMSLLYFFSNSSVLTSVGFQVKQLHWRWRHRRKTDEFSHLSIC